MKKSVLLLEEDYREFQHIKQMLEDLSYEVLPKHFAEIDLGVRPYDDRIFEDYVNKLIEDHRDDLELVLLSDTINRRKRYGSLKIARKIIEYNGADPIFRALLPIVVIIRYLYNMDLFKSEGIDCIPLSRNDYNLLPIIVDSQTIKFERTYNKVYDLVNENSNITNNKTIIKNMKPKVFIVHGRSHLEEKVANVLECLGLEPIILREQANQGMTLIEKIEQYSDVAYAVVLYTPCDEGKLKDASIEELQPRARQNVVFEHGYLMSKLGRNNVCALVEEGVETPGDTSGILYLPLDKENEWLNSLVKEFEASDIEIDHRLLRIAKRELKFMK